MNKSEFYKKIINVHKATGQGMSGIVRVAGSEGHKLGQFLDEFIEEGLIEKCETGGTIGHSESNFFYMPTKGYNVWKDNGGEYQRYKGKYLQYVRFYLGILVDEDRKDMSDDEDTIKKVFLNPSMQDFMRNPHIMLDYAKWLKRNSTALEEMLKLDDFYKEKEIKLSDVELDWLREHSWFKNNKSIGECLRQSNKTMIDRHKLISINKALLDLYKSDSKKYKKEIDKSKNDIEKAELDILKRKRVHMLFESIDNKKTKIQKIIE